MLLGIETCLFQSCVVNTRETDWKAGAQQLSYWDLKKNNPGEVVGYGSPIYCSHAGRLKGLYPNDPFYQAIMEVKNHPKRKETSWWFQPLWKILVKTQIGVKIKHIWVATTQETIIFEIHPWIPLNHDDGRNL